MTREEAIEYLNTLYMALAVFPNQQISLGNVDEMKESVSMAIKALEQEPKPMTRTEEVKRAIDYLLGIWGDYGRHKRAVEVLIAYIENLENEVLQLPSVTPQPKTGHWIEHNTGHSRYYSCSKCSCLAPNTEVSDGVIWKLSKYCPDCGAKMVEPQESEDKE